MEAMTPTHYPGETVLSYKALELLYVFHALKYPEYHNYLLSEELGDVKSREPPEKYELNPNVSLRAKAENVRSYFEPVMAKLRIDNPVRNMREQLVEYCDWQIVSFDHEVLHDGSGRPMNADQILPPSSLIDVMYISWIERNSRRCRPLELFIQASLSPEQ